MTIKLDLYVCKEVCDTAYEEEGFVILKTKQLELEGGYYWLTLLMSYTILKLNISQGIYSFLTFLNLHPY